MALNLQLQGLSGNGESGMLLENHTRMCECKEFDFQGWPGSGWFLLKLLWVSLSLLCFSFWSPSCSISTGYHGSDWDHQHFLMNIGYFSSIGPPVIMLSGYSNMSSSIFYGKVKEYIFRWNNCLNPEVHLWQFKKTHETGCVWKEWVGPANNSGGLYLIRRVRAVLAIVRLSRSVMITCYKMTIPIYSLWCYKWQKTHWVLTLIS